MFLTELKLITVFN